MNVYIYAKFKVFAIVVAFTSPEAANLLETELTKAGFPQIVYVKDLRKVDFNSAGAIILDAGH